MFLMHFVEAACFCPGDLWMCLPPSHEDIDLFYLESALSELGIIAASFHYG